MNIKRAKQEIKDAVQAYLMKDESDILHIHPSSGMPAPHP